MNARNVGASKNWGQESMWSMGSDSIDQATLNVRFSETVMSAMGCGFNRSMQHTRICVSRRSVADEIQDTDSLHRKPKSSDVGALAGWRFSPADRPVVRSIPFINRAHSSRKRRDTTGSA